MVRDKKLQQFVATGKSSYLVAKGSDRSIDNAGAGHYDVYMARTSAKRQQAVISVRLDAWQVGAIAEAVRNADDRRGRSVSHARVRAWVEGWGSKNGPDRPR